MKFVLLLMATLIMALFPTLAAEAKRPPAKLTLSGPGIAGELEITDRSYLEALAMGRLEDWAHGAISTPVIEQRYYEIVRYAKEGEIYLAFDRLRYYPKPGTGGYIWYTGLEGTVWSEFDGKWFNATADGDKTLRRLIAEKSAPILPYSVSPGRAQEIMTLMNFVRTYNAGDLDTTLALLTDEVLWSDCDFRLGRVIALKGKPDVTGWLKRQFADHDQLEIRTIEVNDGDPTGDRTVGLVIARRTSETLKALGFSKGIVPALAAKVNFTESHDRITRFANGPFGGPAALCRLRR